MTGTPVLCRAFERTRSPVSSRPRAARRAACCVSAAVDNSARTVQPEGAWRANACLAWTSCVVESHSAAISAASISFLRAILMSVARSSPLGVPEAIGGSSILARIASFSAFSLVTNSFPSMVRLLQRRHPIALDGNRLVRREDSPGPRNRKTSSARVSRRGALELAGLLGGAVEDGLGPFDEFEIGRYAE